MQQIDYLVDESVESHKMQVRINYVASKSYNIYTCFERWVVLLFTGVQLFLRLPSRWRHH